MKRLLYIWTVLAPVLAFGGMPSLQSTNFVMVPLGTNQNATFWFSTNSGLTVVANWQAWDTQNRNWTNVLNLISNVLTAAISMDRITNLQANVTLQSLIVNNSLTLTGGVPGLILGGTPYLLATNCDLMVTNASGGFRADTNGNVLATGTIAGAAVTSGGAAVLTENQSISLSGDATGSGTTGIAVTVTKYPLSGSTQGKAIPTTATSYYFPFNNTCTNLPTADTVGTRTLIAGPTTWSSFRGVVSSAAGANKGFYFVVMTNGTPVFTNAIAGASATTFTDTGHTLSLVSGDMIGLKLQSSNTAASVSAAWAAE